jgi:cell division protein FtsN
MARDYGHRRSAKRSSAPNQLLVIVVTFLLGYFTATIMDVQKLSQWINSEILAEHDPVKQPVKSAEQKQQAIPKPKFEFYTLLANEKGVSQTSNRQGNPQQIAQSTDNNQQQTVNKSISNAANDSVKAVGADANNRVVQVSEARPVDNQQAMNRRGTYAVQVASFKTRQDAENMKAKLILKGYDVSVVPVSQPQGNWFRVVVGPYPDKSAAQSARINLAKTERLNGMIRSIGG